MNTPSSKPARRSSRLLKNPFQQPATAVQDAPPFFKLLKNGEKQKSHFLLFGLEKSKDGLFQRSNSRLLPRCALGMILALPVHALSTDKDQPIEVEADTAELDDVKNVSIYRGNVIVTQGSIRMTGDVMTVYQTNSDDLDHLILEGKPATYKQLPDDSKVYDEAQALRMEYHEIKNKVILIDQAVVTQEGLRFSGDRIDYDTELSKVKAWSKPPEATAGAETPEAPPRERVKIIIKKKDKSSDVPETGSPGAKKPAAAAPDAPAAEEAPQP